MPYVGEKVRVISRITGYDGEALTGDIIGLVVKLEIFDPGGDQIVTNQAMAWHPVGNKDGPYWFYDWASGTNPAGRYKTEVRASGGVDDIDAFDFGTVRLQKRPAGTGP